MEPKTFTQADLDTIVADADAIAADGKDRDNALTVMAKGMADGIRALAGAAVALSKGKGDDKAAGAKVDDGDEDEADDKGKGDGDEDDASDGDGDEPEDKAGPGFEDMGKGREGEDVMVDVTANVLAIEADMAALRKENKGLRKMLKAQDAKIDGVTDQLNRLAGGLAATLAPMNKALVRVSDQLLDLPAAVHDPGLARRRHAVRAVAEGTGDGSVLLDKVKLAKALQARVIDEDQLGLYRRTGKFSGDQAVHDDKIKAIAAL